MKTNTISRKTVNIDATNRAAGRVASEAARYLQGKHRPTYAPNRDDGDFVVIKGARNLSWTGRKLETEEYKWSTGYLGGLKTKLVRDVFKKDPGAIIRHAIYTMLPKNRLREQRMKRLRIQE